MTNNQQHDLATLTELMRSAWATIYSGHDEVACAVDMEEAAGDEEMGEASVPGPRVQAAWDRMALGEDRVKSGEEQEERVRTLAAAAGVDMGVILATLVEERTRPN